MDIVKEFKENPVLLIIPAAAIYGVYLLKKKHPYFPWGAETYARHAAGNTDKILGDTGDIRRTMHAYTDPYGDLAGGVGGGEDGSGVLLGSGSGHASHGMSPLSRDAREGRVSTVGIGFGAGASDGGLDSGMYTIYHAEIPYIYN